MVKKEKTEEQPKNLTDNVETPPLSSTERFIEENQKTFVYGVIVIVVLVLAIIGYVRFIRTPHIHQAWEEAYKAEFYFERDSFRLALYGDGFFPGFLDVIDDYGRTPMGNASRYYAGVCYMRLGDYDEAIRHLKRFKSNDPMVGAMAMGIIGDANVELGNYNEAVKYYINAVNKAENELISPTFLMKAAKVYEEMGEYQEALKLYERIKTEYYGTSEQHNVEKFIKRAELLSKQ